MRYKVRVLPNFYSFFSSYLLNNQRWVKQSKVPPTLQKALEKFGSGSLYLYNTRNSQQSWIIEDWVFSQHTKYFMKLTLCCITLTLLLGILLGASLGVFFREDILEERWTGGS